MVMGQFLIEVLQRYGADKGFSPEGINVIPTTFWSDGDQHNFVVSNPFHVNLPSFWQSHLGKPQHGTKLLSLDLIDNRSTNLLSRHAWSSKSEP